MGQQQSGSSVIAEGCDLSGSVIIGTSGSGSDSSGSEDSGNTDGSDNSSSYVSGNHGSSDISGNHGSSDISGNHGSSDISGNHGSDISGNNGTDDSGSNGNDNGNSGKDATVEVHTEAILDVNNIAEVLDKVARPKKQDRKPTDPEKLVENAIKYKKIFVIMGGCATVRHSLRKRGWVEKFYNMPVSPKKTSVIISPKYSSDVVDVTDADVDNDDCSDDKNGYAGDQPKVPPWQEDDGIYAEMSNMLHDASPSLFWVLKRDTNDYNFLTKRQMVNHFSNVTCFTTKAGLCAILKHVMWFTNSDPDSFFPRCYLLTNDEEKRAFIDDFRMTACMNIVKIAAQQLSQSMHLFLKPKYNIEPFGSQSYGTNIDVCCAACDKSLHGTEIKQLDSCKSPEMSALKTQKTKRRTKKRPAVPTHVLETAVYQCEKLLACKAHEDLDLPDNAGVLTEEEWEDLVRWSYQIIQEEGQFYDIAINLTSQCETLIERLAQNFPQFIMSGTHNVWIVKPGAKSRGRGIKCYENLADILSLVSSLVAKSSEGKYVVQKYIERPLLIYNTKFDIRQWFLVTDWNPLTVWFYREAYLRFCSQQFTLDDFSESIHLSNNAIQKNYKNGPRSPKLPKENMWTSDEFRGYLRQNGFADVWEKTIYPQMKQAVIGALLVSQDIVDCRKNSFELYGADFMLTEDLSPWLLEINASPSMEPSTAVTAKLCRAVLEDTIKVVIDRKLNRNCDTGSFELAYKQPYVATPSYTGISLCVIGHSVSKPAVKESCNQKKPCGYNTPLALCSVTAQEVAQNRTYDDFQLSSNFSVLGVRDILNNIFFPSGSSIKSCTRSSFESASHHNFLYTIPRSLKHAKSADHYMRSSCHSKNDAAKTKNTMSAQTHKPGARGRNGSKKSEKAENGACKRCSSRHVNHLLAADSTCQYHTNSYLLTLAENELTSGAYNPAECSNHFHHHHHHCQMHCSTHWIPDVKTHRTLTCSCLTCINNNTAARLFASVPQELVAAWGRPASTSCPGSHSTTSKIVRPQKRMAKHICAHQLYENQ